MFAILNWKIVKPTLQYTGSEMFVCDRAHRHAMTVSQPKLIYARTAEDYLVFEKLRNKQT